ncbi:MAG: glycosyltransferase [Atribacterota bacterium]|nr:glycosyltransferase [Atribacterota bacterium]
MKEKLLGEILVEKGLITRKQLEEALALQKETKGLLGEILISHGFLSPFALYQTLAEKEELVYLGKELPKLFQMVDPSVLSLFTPLDLLRFKFFPLHYEKHCLEIATPSPQSTALRKFLQEKFPHAELKVNLITPYELDQLIYSFFQKEFLQEATTGLFFRSPAESAARVFTPFQWLFLTGIAILITAGFLFTPLFTVIILFAIFNLFYTANVVFKFLLSLKGSQIEHIASVTDEEIKTLDPAALPVYTVLLPLHREPLFVIQQLLESIRRLDYPQEKLDVIFLIEEDDPETLNYCKMSKPPYNVRFIIVPRGLPKTKPRACNFGLLFARGEFLTIYDAEDIPDKDQLKKAVAAFQKFPPEFICFQAALNFYNPNQNLLTRLFTLEYSYWFDYLLPGLFTLKLPIPLGGTSNHFRTDILRELGGWDPFNVTEDADLGMRASYRGYRVGILNSTTFEEANSHLKNWIRQRSRWLKGYLQTFLVHNRNPWHIFKKSGFRGWLTLQLFIGGTPLGEAVSVLMWGIFLTWLFLRRTIILPFLPDSLIIIGSFNLLWGNFLGIYLSMLAVFRRNLYTLLPFSILNPFYWILAGIAAWKGIWQLFSRPFFWEKTIHGLHQETSHESKP